MGAFQFETAVAARGGRSGKITSAAEAFRAARDHARWEHGAGGYTGTIAEKSSIVMIKAKQWAEGRGERSRVKRDIPTLEEAAGIARVMIAEEYPPVDDKWGPAGCIAYRKKGGRKVAGWLFFGWASS